MFLCIMLSASNVSGNITLYSFFVRVHVTIFSTTETNGKQKESNRELTGMKEDHANEGGVTR